MTLFRTSLRMAHDATWPVRRKWSNVFYIEAANAAAAAGALAVVWGAELRACVQETVFAYEVYATDNVPGTENYSVLSIPSGNQRGLNPVDGLGEPYLTKACVAVTLNVANSRPSRKFWRSGLYEAYVIDGTLVEPEHLLEIQNAFNAMITAFEGNLRDPDGQVIASVGRMQLTTREFGRTAGADVPQPPPLG